MPVKAELCRDGRVLFYTLSDPLSMDEFAPIALSFEKYYDENLRHVVADTMHLTRLPGNILGFFFQQTKLPHRVIRPDFGYSVVATQSPAIRVVMGVSRHVLPPEKIVVVDSVSEAWEKMDEILAKEAASEAWD